jgi:hypothetical protein
VEDAYGTARLAAKDAESAIIARIGEDFNLTPVLARAHYEQMARYFADYGHMALRPGELCYLAVASSEPPGKPIVACRKVQVALELAGPEDRRILGSRGLADMRQGRLARLAWQAQLQGGLLEPLAAKQIYALFTRPARSTATQSGASTVSVWMLPDRLRTLSYATTTPWLSRHASNS